MSVLSKIMGATKCFSFTRIFTTRDVLALGKRSNVDKSLSRLVDRKWLERLSPGVFRRFKYNNKPADPAQVAAAKAISFGRSIATISPLNPQLHQIMPRLKVKTKTNFDLPQIFFAIEGRTSSFVYGKVRIVLKGIAPRKLALGESFFGRILRLAWLEGVHNSEQLSQYLDKEAPHLTMQESQHTSRFLHYLPWWLAEPWREFLARQDCMVL